MSHPLTKTPKKEKQPIHVRSILYKGLFSLSNSLSLISLKMTKEDFEDYYNISGENERSLWENSLFVFDTSTLIEFYYYSDKARKEIITKIFLKLKGRLWVTSHTQFEYLRNRESVYKKPYIEKYKKIENDDIPEIRKEFTSLKNKLNDFFQKTSKKDIHPYIDQSRILGFKSRVEKLHDNLLRFETIVKKEFAERENELKELEKDDIILKMFLKQFNVTREYSIETINDTILEGERRFQHKIPPGFKDAGKEGIQKFGDLIIWKQIIELSKDQNKDIILVTNDVKEDWCYSVKRSNENRIEKPKEDLITEFKGLTKNKFWMYTFSQFLYKSNEYILAQITETSLSEINEANRKLNEVFKISFEGIYRTEKINNSYWQYIKFYANGTVKTVSTLEEDSSSMFFGMDNPHFIASKFNQQGNKIEFHSRSQNGVVEYDVEIKEDRLVATKFSRINGNVEQLDYFFIHCADIVK